MVIHVIKPDTTGMSHSFFCLFFWHPAKELPALSRSGLLGLNNRKGPLELRNFGFAILVHVIALVVVLLQFFVLLAFLVSMTVRLSSLDI